MDLRHLRYFVEIAEQGSLSRAAMRLNVAQPALSIHLRNMEADVGTPLLLRSRNGVQPTKAGEMLLRHARRMLAEQAAIEDELRNMGREPGGEVRLGLPGTLSDIVTVPLIEAVGQRFPRIRLTVSEAMSGFVAEWLRDGLVDLGGLYARPDDPGLDSLHLLDEQLVVIAAPRRMPGPLDLAALAAQPLILPSRAHGLRKMLDAAAEAQGERLSPLIEIDSYKNIKALTIRGTGLSVLPLHAVADECMAGRLVSQPLHPALWRSIWLVKRRAGAQTRSIGAVHDLIIEIVEDLVRQGTWIGAKLG